MKFSALAALVGFTQAASFPSFDSFHAHCQIDYTTSDSCATAFSSFHDTLDGFQDPASPQGTYTSKQETSPSEIWTQRKTANGKYTDNVRFNFADSGNGCAITSQSQSISLSYYDYSVNYCNMFNVLRTVYSDLEIKDVSNSKCGYPATDVSTCDRY